MTRKVLQWLRNREHSLELEKRVRTGRPNGAGDSGLRLALGGSCRLRRPVDTAGMIHLAPVHRCLEQLRDQRRRQSRQDVGEGQNVSLGENRCKESRDA